jgi:uncharacterized protein (DUF1800 family)
MRLSRFTPVKLSAALLMTGAVFGLSCANAKDAPANATLSPSDLALLNRVTWGVSASSAADMARLGPAKWLDGQLHPATGDHLPPDALAQIDALPISHTTVTDLARNLDAEAKAANAMPDPDQKKAAQQAYQQDLQGWLKQAVSREILRDVYSSDQLKEQMTWFWFNHFNVHQGKANLRVLVGDYDDHAIRDHAMGRFRDLLEATLKHPAMLRYLDNADNAAGHINENYAREIMELHTMGVGSGYTQTDVQELARILTGVGIDQNPQNPKLKPELQSQLIRDGLFEFNPARHDYGDKAFLGHTIKGRGFGEVEEALDILAKQPATARHVSTQLATYFVSDTPPPALVDKMAQTFQRSNGDIAATLETLFRSPEFKASLGTQFKDPAHYAISAVRLAYDDRVILNTQPIQNWMNRLAEPLYNHETPDGYPMSSAAWDGPGQMAARFEVARQIGSGPAGLFKPDAPGATDHPGFPQLQNALYYDALSKTLAPPTQASLQQAVSAQDWNTLFLSSPDFMHR